ncbi:DnaJ central domain protein [compost metagenome]
MQKGQGLGFKRQRIELEPCPVCKGRAVVQGISFELICTDCNGSGWVVLGSRLVLSSDELVTQLSFKLQRAQREIEVLKQRTSTSGRAEYHQMNNRRGAGGTNYTGD